MLLSLYFTGKCDPLVLKCEYHQNKNPIKSTFIVNWRCDGENDCGNNFDESKCNGISFILVIMGLRLPVF